MVKIALGIIVFLIACYGVFFEWLCVNSIFISSIANISVFMSAIFVGYQAKIFAEDYTKRNKKLEFGTSFQLTNFYINNIIPEMDVISAVFYRTKIIEIIKKKVAPAELKEFDEQELSTILTPEERKHFQEDVNTVGLDILLQALGMDVNSSQIGKEMESIAYFSSFNQEKREEVIKRYTAIQVDLFHKVIVKTTNNLEYFAMYFNSNLAESEVVYRSLHQTYLDLMRMLYPYIAMKNVENSRKYFTNAIALYLKWNAQEKKERKMEIDGIKTVQKTINNINSSKRKI